MYLAAGLRAVIDDHSTDHWYLAIYNLVLSVFIRGEQDYHD